MSQEISVAELRKKSQQLLNGSLKQCGGSGSCGGALLPLVAVNATVATPGDCASAGFACGTVFNDLNHDGIQQVGEPGLGMAVTITDGATSVPGLHRHQRILPHLRNRLRRRERTVFTPVPTGFQVSPAMDCLTGVQRWHAQQRFSVIDDDGQQHHRPTSDSSRAAHPNPGTGTIGYWKNHPEAWPPSGRFGRRPDYSAAARDLVDQQGRQGQEHDDVRNSSSRPS